MNGFLEFISQPWHWAASGFTIAMVMLLMLLLGKRFGVSSSYEGICSMGGAGKLSSLFDFDWKNQSWLFMFLIGTILGGYLAINYLSSPQPVQISAATAAYAESLGVIVPQTLAEGAGYVPEEIFTMETLFTLKGLLLFVGGGFLVGFGARWARGCTSGHAISGLSNLQWPSLLTVVGFFIGGLLMTNILLPLVMSL